MNTQNNQNQIPVAQSDQPTLVQAANQPYTSTQVADQTAQTLEIINSSKIPAILPIEQQPPAPDNPVNIANSDLKPTTDNDEGNILFRRQQNNQEREQINSMLEEIEQTNFNQLIAKYGLEHLAIMVLGEKPITYKSVVDQYAVYRQFMVSDFIKPEVMATFPQKSKDRIITLIAGLKPDENPANIQTWLTQIDQNLILPQNFQIADNQPQAYKLWQAAENIKKIIVESSYNEYFGDVKKLLLLSNNQYEQTIKKISLLSEEIDDEYKPENLDKPSNPELKNKILALFSDFGRTPLFIEDMKKEKIFGNMVEMFSKIEYAAEISNFIRSKNLQQPIPDETITSEVKSYLYQNIALR
jgi:hypothetical protein